MSQKELQRVSVINACIKGDMAHANRGRPSHRRPPKDVASRIVQLARTTYAGFNDHHLCEKLVEREGFSLSRETLRRLLRKKSPAQTPCSRSSPAPLLLVRGGTC